MEEVKIQLVKEEVDKLFEECSHQSEVVVSLYRMVYPDYDQIKKVEGWPSISKQTSEYLFKKFITFDKKYHPTVFSGGLWMNNGFSTCHELTLEDFEVIPAPVEYYKEGEGDG